MPTVLWILDVLSRVDTYTSAKLMKVMSRELRFVRCLFFFVSVSQSVNHRVLYNRINIRPQVKVAKRDIACFGDLWRRSSFITSDGRLQNLQSIVGWQRMRCHGTIGFDAFQTCAFLFVAWTSYLISVQSCFFCSCNVSFQFLSPPPPPLYLHPFSFNVIPSLTPSTVCIIPSLLILARTVTIGVKS